MPKGHKKEKGHLARAAEQHAASPRKSHDPTTPSAAARAAAEAQVAAHPQPECAAPVDHGADELDEAEMAEAPDVNGVRPRGRRGGSPGHP